MCVNPTIITGDLSVGCRLCWQCRQRAIDDWTGRNIAESLYSYKAHMVTLTYGRDENDSPDHLRAAVLTYSDVQKMFKRLRKKGHMFRYFCVGEYGTLKKRAHWHLLMYWQTPPPDIEKLGEAIDWKHWPHGHSHFTKVYPETIKYVCKYIQKGEENIESRVYLSTVPPLGSEHFTALAKRYVRQGIAPTEPFYHFPGMKKKFCMKDTTLRNFLNTFVTEWKKQRPGQHIPASELVEEYEDTLVVEIPRIELAMSDGEKNYRERLIKNNEIYRRTEEYAKAKQRKKQRQKHG
jgi:hypothetical protein